MEKKRTDNNTSESGVALVMALLITTLMLLLIVSLSFFYETGYRANTINKQFSTAYDAAQAGVEHSSGIVNAFLKGATDSSIGDIGSVDDDDSLTSNDKIVLGAIVTTCASGSVRITTGSADGNYSIVTTVACLGIKPIPGYGGALRFPPPTGAVASGIGGMATKYLYYSEISIAKETSNTHNPNIGQTEAVQRAMQ